MTAMTVASGIIAELTRRHLTIAVAESLTGGLLVAELIRPAGASVVVRGGIVAYSTQLKHTLLGVNSETLAVHGPVYADVAIQMAVGVRTALATSDGAAAIGISTTGVAGPGPSDGHPAGTVYVGLSFGNTAKAFALNLTGDRDEIRSETVRIAMAHLADVLPVSHSGGL